MDYLDEFARTRESARRANNEFPGRPSVEIETALDALLAQHDRTNPREGTMALQTGLLAARIGSRLVNWGIQPRAIDLFVAGSLSFADPSQLAGPLETFRPAIEALRAATGDSAPIDAGTEAVKVAKFFCEAICEHAGARSPREAIAQMKERPARFHPTYVAALELAIRRPGAPLVKERAAAFA